MRADVFCKIIRLESTSEKGRYFYEHNENKTQAQILSPYIKKKVVPIA